MVKLREKNVNNDKRERRVSKFVKAKVKEKVKDKRERRRISKQEKGRGQS